MMPHLKIFTNLQRSQVPKDFVLKILPVLSKTVKKPVENFIVTVVPDTFQSMDLADSSPSVVASLESIGHLGREENKVIAVAITEFMEKELGVVKDRIFLTFYDLKGFNVAKGAKTCD